MDANATARRRKGGGPLRPAGSRTFPDRVRWLHFLILTMPDREVVNLSLREGIDFLDEPWPDFGPFYILETT